MTATDTLTYNENEIRRIAVKAFETAMKRRKSVKSVDNTNVSDSSGLWRKVVNEAAWQYPDVTLQHISVYSCAMQPIKYPTQFDVMVTENMYGDILSDEASMIAVLIDMLPHASFSGTKFGLYEPISGSAPNIARKNIANPTATVFSVSMMLRYSFDGEEKSSA